MRGLGAGSVRDGHVGGIAGPNAGWALLIALALVSAMLVGAPVDATAQVPQVGSIDGLELVGHSDLGGGGLNGDVAVVGDTAIVAQGILPGGGIHTHLYNPYPCPAVSARIVDVSDPTDPTVTATIPFEEGVAVADVDALTVSTPHFSGDLAAIALAGCSFPGFFVHRGVVYYDITDPADPQFLGRYFADEDMVGEDAPECGPGAGAACASSQHSVDLVARPDGRVLSLSTEPFASAAGFTSGDLRIVDVTDPRNPTQVGSWPLFDQIPPAGEGATFNGFSNNGCRPFDAAHSASASADGNLALTAYMDQGLFNVDISDPSQPEAVGQLDSSDGRSDEGNAAYAAYADVGGLRLALVGEEDWIAPSTRLRIDSPSDISGDKFACEAMFTLFDSDRNAQIYNREGMSVPENSTSTDILYVGRGCPGDTYLAPESVTNKVVFADRSNVQEGLTGFCRADQKVQRAQDEGAVAVVIGQTSSFAPQAFSFDGDPAGLDIPLIMIDRADAEAIRNRLCPTPEDGDCSGGESVTGFMFDQQGEWGGLRIVDITDPTAPTELTTYRSPRAGVFPPPDLGVYAVHHADVRGSLAYLASNSDGLRVLDLANGTAVGAEIASFVPPDTPDPTGVLPSKAYVVGVATVGNKILVSDINSGLYVLAFEDVVRRLGGEDRIETAVLVSQDSFPDGGADAVVLSRSDLYPDALAGTPFAVENNAPLLLTSPTALDTQTAAELGRVLGAGGTVYLLGGDRAVSPDVEQAVEDLGFETQRVAGKTRIETAIAIAEALGNPDDLMVTTGYDFPDALAAGTAAAHIGAAVLLTESESRNATTDAYLQEHPGATVYAVGGPAARPYSDAIPVFGSDREATAVAVAERFFDSPGAVGIARRDKFPDSMTGGAHIARHGGPMLITPTGTLHTETGRYLCDEAVAIDLAFVYGGTEAISQTVADAVAARINGVVC